MSTTFDQVDAGAFTLNERLGIQFEMPRLLDEPLGIQFEMRRRSAKFDLRDLIDSRPRDVAHEYVLDVQIEMQSLTSLS